MLILGSFQLRTHRNKPPHCPLNVWHQVGSYFFLFIFFLFRLHFACISHSFLKLVRFNPVPPARMCFFQLMSSSSTCLKENRQFCCLHFDKHSILFVGTYMNNRENCSRVKQLWLAEVIMIRQLCNNCGEPHFTVTRYRAHRWFTSCGPWTTRHRDSLRAPYCDPACLIHLNKSKINPSVCSHGSAVCVCAVAYPGSPWQHSQWLQRRGYQWVTC